MKIGVFYCSNSLDKADLDRYLESIEETEFHAIGLPCSGKVTIPYLVKSFETGSEGILIITCPDGQCHNLEGNKRAQKRTQAVDSLLQEVGLGSGRIEVIQLKDGQAEQVVEGIKVFCTSIKSKSQELITQNSSLSPEKTK